MTDRRSWTKEEDDAIFSLVRTHGVRKWTMISQHMQNKCVFSTRSGK